MESRERIHIYPTLGEKQQQRNFPTTKLFSSRWGEKIEKVYGTSHLLNRFNVVRQLLFGESIFRAFPLIFSPARTQFNENGAGGMSEQEGPTDSMKI